MAPLSTEAEFERCLYMTGQPSLADSHVEQVRLLQRLWRIAQSQLMISSRQTWTLLVFAFLIDALVDTGN